MWKGRRPRPGGEISRPPARTPHGSWSTRTTEIEESRTVSRCAAHSNVTMAIDSPVILAMMSVSVSSPGSPLGCATRIIGSRSATVRTSVAQLCWKPRFVPGGGPTVVKRGTGFYRSRSLLSPNEGLSALMQQCSPHAAILSRKRTSGQSFACASKLLVRSGDKDENHGKQAAARWLLRRWHRRRS